MADGGVARYQGKTESAVRLSDPDDLLSTYYSQMTPQAGETTAERKARRAKERELEEAAEAEQRPLARLLRAVGSGESKLYKALYPTQETVMSRQQGREVAPIEAAIVIRAEQRLGDFPGLRLVLAPNTEQAPPPRKEQRGAADVVRQASSSASTSGSRRGSAPVYTAPTPRLRQLVRDWHGGAQEVQESAYAELRKLYEPEEKELAQRRGQRGGEALLRAGLAMMSGTSRMQP
jgi:hypothetical protein